MGFDRRFKVSRSYEIQHMSNQSRVGVLYAPHGAASLRDIYIAASGICDVVIVIRRQVAQAHPKVVAAAQMVFDEVVIWDDGAPLGNLELAGFTTFHDTELDAVDRELVALGLPGVGRYERPWDKLVQRTRLNAAGASRLPIAAVSSPMEFHDALTMVGRPAVLKPRRGASGSGIALIETLQDVAHQLEHRTVWNDLLLEKMLDPGRHPSSVAWLGDFVSVETENVGTHRRHHSFTPVVRPPPGCPGSGFTRARRTRRGMALHPHRAVGVRFGRAGDRGQRSRGRPPQPRAAFAARSGHDQVRTGSV